MQDGMRGLTSTYRRGFRLTDRQVALGAQGFRYAPVRPLCDLALPLGARGMSEMGLGRQPNPR